MKFGRDVENLIASLRGLPENRSRSKLRETQSAEDLVQRVLERYRIGSRTPEDTIMEHWTDLVGATSADFSRLMRIDDQGRAIIGVSNPIVRQELFFHRREVLTRIRKLSGCSEIKAIVLRAG